MAGPTDNGTPPTGKKHPEADTEQRTVAPDGAAGDGPPLPEQLAEEGDPQGAMGVTQAELENAIPVQRPAPGLEATVPVVPGQPLRLEFDNDEVSGRELDGDNLVLEFPDGAQVILLDYLVAFGLAGELATNVVEADGSVVPITELLAPAAGPGAGGPGASAGGLGINSPFELGDLGPGLDHLGRLGNEDLTFSVPIPDEDVDTDILAVQDDDDGGNGPTDVAPVLSIDDVVVNEDAGTATFTVTRHGSLANAATVDFATADRSAVDPADYQSTTGTLTFDTGVATRTVTVPIADDAVPENIEDFRVLLSNPTGADIADGVGVGTILDDDTPGSDGPRIFVRDVTVEEGGSATFTLTLSEPSSETVTVDFATASGSAVENVDYTGQTGTVTFLPGNTTATVTIDTTEDAFDEPDELFTLNLSNPSNAQIGDSTGTGTIVDDDGGAGGDTQYAIDNVTVTEGGVAVFTVVRTGDVSANATIDFATADASALDGADYTGLGGTLSFAAGETSKTIAIATIEDQLVENPERFVVNLSNATDGTIVDASGVGTIIDDDTAPTLVIDDVVVNESDGTATFTVTRHGNLDGASTVRFATADGSAASPDDYTSTTGTLSFAPGEATQTITVGIADDAIPENTESFRANLFDATGATIADHTGVGTILDNDTPDTAKPRITVTDVTVVEGVAATFTLALSQPSTDTVTVDFTTASGSAIEGVDYTGQSGTVTFLPGVTTATVTVATTEDALDEPDELFMLNLSNAQNADIADHTGTGTIIDDDGDAGGDTQLAIDNVTVTEGGVALFTVTRMGDVSSASTVDFATGEGSALDPEDYTGIGGTLSFAAGETSKTVAVTTLDDSFFEGAEQFVVNLSNATDATIVDATGVGTIIDNDAAPVLSINDVVVNESDGTATFTVTRSGDLSGVSTVKFATADGTAVEGDDYSETTGTLTFAPGEPSQTITVPITDDAVFENPELFLVNLSDPFGASIADDTGVGVILDDDDAPALPRLTISDSTVIEGDTATFTVSLSAASSDTVTVDFASFEGSALDPEDYAGLSGTLTFLPGETSKAISIDTTDDTLEEALEEFGIALSNATNAIIADPTGVGRIVDNDDPGGTTQVAIDDVTVNESDGTATFTVTRSGDPSTAFTVDFATGDGSAAAPDDYISQAGTLSFAAGQLTQTITVPITDDNIFEIPEQFQVNLSNATNGTTIVDATGVGTILDDDPGLKARDDMDMTKEGLVTSGNVITGAEPDPDPVNQGALQSDDIGAGSPLLRSISHDGITYTLNAAKDGVDASDGSTAHNYNDATGILTFTTALGGTIAIDLDGANPGSYTYTAPPEVAHIDALLGVPFDDPQLGVSKSLGQWLDLFDDGNTTLRAFDVSGGTASFAKKNVSFTLNGLEYNYSGIGVAGSGGRDAETDFVEGQGAEQIEVGFDAPLLPGAMVGVGALFDGSQPGVPFDGDNLEKLEWEAWLGGSMVSSGTVDGTANGLANFTIGTAFDTLVLLPVQISPGSDEGGSEADFLLQYIHGVHLDDLQEQFGYVLEDAALQQDDAILTIDVKDAVPVAVDDDEMVTEGQSITDNVLANDTFGADTTGAGIHEIVHGGVAYTLANADPSGVVTIDTLLGGQLRINLLTGEYTYDAAPSLDHAGGPLVEGFSYVLMDGDWDTDSATLAIEIKDGVPVARDDKDMVEEGGQQTTGNVITGVDTDLPPVDGMLVADDEGPDTPNVIREIHHNGITYTLSDDELSVAASDGSTAHGYNPLNGELTIDTALGGTLTIDLTGANRGFYTYTSPPRSAGIPDGIFEVAPGSVPSFVDITADDGAGGPATVFTDPNRGFGVESANDDGDGRRFKEINQNNDGTRETLTFDFNGVDASEARIDLSFFFANERGVGNERGRWQAFDDGVLVGEADFESTSNSGNFSFTISGIGEFDKLVFTAIPGSADPVGGDSSDYYVKAMAVTLADARESFGYTLEDTDGSRDSATLVIDVKEDAEEPAVDAAENMVDEAALSDGTDPGSTAEIATGTLNFSYGGDGPGEISAFAHATAGAATRTGDTYIIDTPEWSIEVDAITGAYIFTLKTDVAHPLPNQTGVADQIVETFTFEVTDGDGSTTTGGTLDIAIKDDGPQALDDEATLGESSSTSGNVLSNDELGADDAPSGGAVTAVNGSAASVGNAVAGTYGTLTLNADGSWTYEADGSIDLSSGPVTDSFTYTVADGDGDASTARLDLVVTDQGPVAELSIDVRNLYLAPNALDIDSSGFDVDDFGSQPWVGQNSFTFNGRDADPDNDITVTAVRGGGASDASLQLSYVSGSASGIGVSGGSIKAHNDEGLRLDFARAAEEVVVTLSDAPLAADDYGRRVRWTVEGTDAHGDPVLVSGTFEGNPNGAAPYDFVITQEMLTGVAGPVKIDSVLLDSPAGGDTNNASFLLNAVKTTVAGDIGPPTSTPGGEQFTYTIEDRDGDALTIENQDPIDFAGGIVINEVGLDVGAAPDATVDTSYVELRNVFGRSLSANDLSELSIELVGPAGTKVTIDLGTLSGKPSVPNNAFLTLYENGEYEIVSVGGTSLETGTYTLPGGSFGFGHDTSEPIAVNLVEDGSTSIDALLANGVVTTELTGAPVTTGRNTGPGTGQAMAAALFGATASMLANDQFNAMAGDRQAVLDQLDIDRPLTPGSTPTAAGETHHVFARSFVADGDGVGDWTTAEAPTEGALNRRAGDANPQDPADDLDPAQGAGGNERDAGQTVLDAAVDGDALEGGRGMDFLYGDADDNVLIGGNHDDVIFGGSGNDFLDGGTGADLLVDVDGMDTLIGGSGDDILIARAGAFGEVAPTSDAGDVLIGDNVTDASTNQYNLTLGIDVSGSMGWSVDGEDNTPPSDPRTSNGVADEAVIVNDDPSKPSNVPTAGGISGAATPAGHDVIVGGDLADVIFGDNLALDGDAKAAFDADAPSFDLRGFVTTHLTDGRSDDFDRGLLDLQHSFGSSDTISGGAGDDMIFGQGGMDEILGDGGADVIFGGAGHDWIEGGEGNDWIDGGQGDDTVAGDGGANIFVFEGDAFGDDTVADFRPGLDQLELRVAGVDSLSDVTITASGPNTVITMAASAGTITLLGVTPGDLDAADFIFNPGALGAGPGAPTLFKSSTVVEEPDVPSVPDHRDVTRYDGGAGLYGNARVDGSNGDDVVGTAHGHDVADGGNGDDRVFSLDGNDRLEGGRGDDVVTGGEGHDRLYGENGDDQLFGEGGNDYLSGGRDNDVLVGGTGHDTLEAGNGDDSLFGGTGNDTLRARRGDDLLDGGGWDTLEGGAGDDELQVPDMNVTKIDGGTGTDTLRFAEAVNIDFGAIGDAKIQNVEILDLRNEAEDTVQLGLQDVLDITDSGTELTIMGDRADRVEADFTGHSVEVATTSAEYTTYVIGGGAATVNIDNDIDQDVSGNIV